MEGGMLLLSILAIIAVILVAAAIIAVIGNMIIGAFDGGKKQEKDNTQEYQSQKSLTQQNEAATEYDFETINRAKAEKEMAMKQEPVDEFKFDDDDNDEDISAIEESLKQKNQPKQEEIEEEDDFDDVDSLLEDISNEVVNDEKGKEEPVVASSSLDKYNISTYLDEEDEEDEEEEEEPVVTPEPIIIDHSEEVEALKAQLAEANRQLEEARNSKVEDASIDMTEESCLERLAILEERLKNAKADLKVNMKEYRPLKKTMSALERYQTKLRRKESVVANKKIALYGVNKYVDIDKEQAENLLNETELLSGLRLSVQHCEEVIAANKDRFPILEHTNKILTADIENLEQDIEYTKQILEKIRAKKNESNDGEGEQE